MSQLTLPKFLTKRNIWIFLKITFGCVILNLGFYFFLLPSHLITGGVMGISIILEPWFKPSYTIFIFNTGLLIVSLFFLGRDFFLKSIYLSLLTPIINFFLDNIFHVNNAIIVQNMSSEFSKLLISSVMGGLIVGSGLGIVLRENAATGGIDIPQKMISKFTHIPFSKAMYMTDGLVIVAGFIVYLQDAGFEQMFLAVLSMLISGMVIDRISIKGRSGYSYFIISDHNEEIKKAIFQKLSRGVTLLHGEGGYTGEIRKTLVCNITKREKITMDELINVNDEKAFVFIMESMEILGYGFSRDQALFQEQYEREKREKRGEQEHDLEKEK